MKTSTMVWVLIVVLIALGFGWYVWSEGSTPMPTPVQTTGAPMQLASTSADSEVSGNATSPAGGGGSVASTTTIPESQ